MEQYHCMIVDDEQDAIDYLSTLIKENCPELKITGTATSSAEAKKLYFKNLPDLIFLDIEIDEQNGFELLSDIYGEKPNPQIIFVTAYNHYAIEAFKANAIDYLLKPMDENELRTAVEKFTRLKDTENVQARIEKLLNQFPKKIRFNTRTGFIFLNTNEIIYCEAERNYTKVYTAPDKFELISLNLAQVEKKLPRENFWRISRSYTVNSEFVTSMDRVKKKCYLKSQNQELTLPASNDYLRKLEK